MPHKLMSGAFHVLFFVAVACSSALAANQTVFWLEPRSNITFDNQITKEVSKRAGMVVLRARWSNPNPDFTLKAIIGQFKSETDIPILTYAWATRYTKAGRSEADLLRNFEMSSKNSLSTIKGDGSSQVDFLDIRDSSVRSRVVSQFVRARNVLGVDGFAIDLSTRTPTVRPEPLARLCKQELLFCTDYAAGMDALFNDLREGLGQKSVIAYNGLFNFTPGQLADQAKLLESADAVAIEYFGMDPNLNQHNFTKDIKPYIDIIPKLPSDKTVMVFGRGPWFYTDYVQDYLWQRYLYACFLLAARPNDYFKFHASFQVPAHRGRAGGLDYYADWEIDLGLPSSPAKESNGLWVRKFAKGLVGVAPDDGRGGVLLLDKTYITPEGIRRQGSLRLLPGEGVVLLTSEQTGLSKPATQEIDARSMVNWRWGGAKLVKSDGSEALRVQGAEQTGEHDVVLDYARSTIPYEHLEIDAKLLEPSAAILAVAEVDDPNRLYTHVVVKITGEVKRVDDLTFEDEIPLRSHAAKNHRVVWPTLQFINGVGKDSFTINSAAFKNIGYKFRRWSHLRLAGSVEVSRIKLSNQTNLLKTDD